jgi:hypothetical protein
MEGLGRGTVNDLAFDWFIPPALLILEGIQSFGQA